MELDRGDERRAAILDRLAAHVLTRGISASSLRPLARAAGTSDRMLLYYFKDKAAVMAAVLELLSQRLVALLDAHASKAPLPLAQLCRDLPAILLSDDLWPYMRIWLEIASLSAGGDSLYRALGERLGRGFLAWGAAQLDSPTAAAREAHAARLLVTMEGLVLLKSIGLEDVARRAI